ncbi:MAG TPA: hypothetical protein VEX15_22560 [Nocardioidaceae bacterium]|nr:hypothetical protein [Nocardioidaceae bacterium]
MADVRPAYIDEHSIRIEAARDEVWTVLHDYAERLRFTAPWDGVARRLLGTQPPGGFAIVDEETARLIALDGRHRFARYRLEFDLSVADGASRLSARSYGDFPGIHGRAYRAVVVGTRGHVLAVRYMLHTIRRRCTG